MPVTNRKKKKKSEPVVATEKKEDGTKEEDPKESTEEAPQERRIMRRLASVVLAVIATASVQRLYKAQRLFGWTYFLPNSFKQLSLSSEEWQSILTKKTVLFIGGHHRAGTTLLWDCLRRHHSIAGFGDKTGSDFSEGIFIQDVYPTFGIGRDFERSIPAQQKNQDKMPAYDPSMTVLETVIDVILETLLIRSPVRKRLNQTEAAKKIQGLGRYALAPENDVHWTPETRESEINTENQARLLNRFGYHWTLSKIHDPKIHFLLEKSPPNALLSQFLQSLINIGHCTNQTDYSCWISSPQQYFNNISSAAHFIFLQRHPLATSLAHLAWRDCQGLTLNDLMAHWVAVSLYMHIDLPKLQQATLIHLEHLVEEPVTLLTSLFDWLGLDPLTDDDLSAITKDIYPDPNAKYLDEYCSSHYTRENHAALQDTWQDAVSRFGYDLAAWGMACEARADDEFTAPASSPSITQ